MDRINKFFTKNLFWKLISIISAVLLWFVVMNIENPVETRVFYAPLTLSNLEELDSQDIALTNQNVLEKTEILIRVRGTRIALDKLYSIRSGIKATIDFKVLYGFNEQLKRSVPITIELPGIGETFEVIEKNPAHVEVETEKVTVAQRKITAVVSGDVADGYVALLPEVTPSSIDIRAPQSILDTIDSVHVFVDVNGASNDLELVSEPKIYDRNEEVIVGLNKNVSEVRVKVPINKHSKIPLRVANQGLPAEGYTLESISCEPKSVEIVGKDEDIKSLTEIILPVVNIQDLSENYKETVDVRKVLPSNVSIKNGTPNEVTITVLIKKLLTKELLIPIDNVNITGVVEGLEYKILSNDFKLRLRGIEDKISGITENDLIASADVKDLEPGTHELPLSLQLPNNATLLDEIPKINIEIYEQTLITDDNINETDDENSVDDENSIETDDGEVAGEVDEGIVGEADEEVVGEVNGEVNGEADEEVDVNYP